MSVVRIGKLKIFNDVIGDRTRDLLACSIPPEPNTLPHALFYMEAILKESLGRPRNRGVGKNKMHFRR
jgi:hypothetical protein